MRELSTGAYGEVHNTYGSGHCGFGAKHLGCDSRGTCWVLEIIYHVISSKLLATVFSIVLDWMSALPVDRLEGLKVSSRYYYP